MKIAKYFRNYTFVLVLSVIVVTLITMRVAYSAAFSVKSASTVQQINTGTLNVVIDNTLTQGIDIEELFPTTSSDLPTAVDSVVTGNYATLVINNTGTLNSAFSVAIDYDADSEDLPDGATSSDFISFNYLIVGIYNVGTGNWVPFGSSYYKQIGDIEPNGEGAYPILRDNISAPANINQTVSKTYRVYIWLREDTPISEIGKLAFLKLNVKSTTKNDGVNS